MASDVDNVCASDPNYAAICSFIDQFGDLLGLGEISFTAIKNFLENSAENDGNLKEILIKLLRRVGQRCENEEKLHKALVKFLQKHSKLDAWEVERFGFAHSEVATKIRALKLLLEAQFDKNGKFKERVNERTTVDLRLKPVGRDKNGMSYWYLLDKEANILIYREEQDSEDKEGFKLVCTNREELATLITNLQDGGDLVSLKSEDSQSVTSNTSKVSELKEDDGSLPPLKEEDGEAPESSTDKPLDVTKSEIKSEVKEEEKKDVVPLNVKEDPSKETKTEAKLTNGEKQEQDEDEPAEEVLPEHEDKSTDDNDGKNDAGIENQAKEDDVDTGKSPTPPLKSPTPRVASPIPTLRSPTPPPKSPTPPLKSTTPRVASPIPTLRSPTPPPKSPTPPVKSATLPPKIPTPPVRSATPPLKSATPPPKSATLPVKSPTSPVASPTPKDSERPERAEKCLKRVEEVEDEIPAKARRRSGSADNPSIVVTDTSNQEKVLLEKNDSQSENIDKQHSTDEPVEGESVQIEQSDAGSPDKKEERTVDVTEKAVSISDTTEQNVTDSSEMQEKKMTEVKEKIAPNEPEQIADNVEKKAQSEKMGEISTEPAADVGKGTQVAVTKDAEVAEAGVTASTSALEADETYKPGKTDESAEKTSTDVAPDKELEETATGDGAPSKEPADESVEPGQSSEKVDDATEATSNDHNGDLEEEEEEEDESKDAEEDTPKKGKRKREKMEIPVEHLRRSTRSQKKRKILYEEIENIPPVKASRKNKHQSSPSKSGGKKRRGDRGDRGLGSSSDSDTPLSRVRSKRAREKSMETSAKCRKLAEEAVKKKSKRKKADSDEDFSVKGKKKGRKRRKSSGSSGSSSDVIEEGSESEELRFGASSDSDEFAAEDSDSDVDSCKVKKGRNARRQEARQEKAAPVEDDNKACHICQKHEHPEWILLCDACDDGYHTTCLRPPLMLIPEGDWFCPPCEHKVLIESLSGRLKLLDQQLKKREHLVIRKERLAFINVNLDNILKDGGREEVVIHSKHKKKKKKKDRHRSPSPFQRRSSRIRDRYMSDESEEESSYEEEVLFTRSTRRRKEINYHFDDYDQLIDEAIGEEVKAVQSCPKPGPKPGRSRGKDIANIEGMEEVENERPPGVMVGRGKRRGRRLTCLDVDDASNDDDSEEYKASEDSVSHVESEDDFLDDNSDSVSGDSEVVRASRRKSGKKSRAGRFARYRADGFVVGSDADSDDDAARPSRRARRRRVDYRDRDSDTSDEITKNLAPKKSKTKGRKSDSDFQASDQSSGTEVEQVVSDKDTGANSKKKSSDENSSEEVSPKSKRHKYEEDSDFSGHVPRKLKKVYKHKAKLYKKVTGKHKSKRKDSSTEESETEETEKKKKKKKNVIESDSEEETEAEDESDHEGEKDKSEDEPTQPSEEASVDKKEGETEAVEEGSLKEGTAREGNVKEATVEEGTVKEGTEKEGPVKEGEEAESSGEEEDEEDEEEDGDEEGGEDSEGDMHVISKKPKLKTKPVSVKKEPSSKPAAAKALKTEDVAPTGPIKTPAEIKKEVHVAKSKVSKPVTKPPAEIKKEAMTKSKVSKPVIEQAAEKQVGDQGQKPQTAVLPKLPIVKQEPVDLPPEPVPTAPPPVNTKLECESRQSPPVTQALPRQPVVKPEPRDVNSPAPCPLAHILNMPSSTMAGIVKPEHRQDSCRGSPVHRHGSPPVHCRDSPILKPRMGSPHNISPGPLPHPHTSYASPPPHNNSGLISYRPQFGIMGHGSRPQVQLPPGMNTPRRPEYPPQGFPLHGGPMGPYQYGPPHLPPHMMPRGVPPQYSGHLMEMQRMVSPMDNHTVHHNGGGPPQPHGPPPPLVRAPPPLIGALPPHGSQMMAPNNLAPHGVPMPGARFPMDGSRIPHPMDLNYRMPLDNRNATPPVSGTPPTGSPRPQAGPGRKKEEEDLSEVSDLLSFVSGFEKS